MSTLIGEAFTKVGKDSVITRRREKSNTLTTELEFHLVRHCRRSGRQRQVEGLSRQITVNLTVLRGPAEASSPSGDGLTAVVPGGGRPQTRPDQLDLLARRARWVWFGKDTTTITHSARDSAIDERMTRINETDSDWDREKLQGAGLAKLRRSIRDVIKVGAKPRSSKERKHIEEDAISRRRSIEEGIHRRRRAALLAPAARPWTT